MPLFNLASIDFGTNRSGNNLDNTGLSEAFRERTGRGYNIHRYPIDLGNYDKGHYVLFHINEQTQSSYATNSNIGEMPTVIANEYATGLTRTAVSSSLLGGSLNINVDIGSNPVMFRRPIQRTKDTIALYMPDTMLFNFNQQYSETPTTGLMAGFLAAAKSAFDGYQTNQFKGAFSNLTPFLKSGAFEIAKNYANDKGLIGAAQQQILGFVQNPALELLYSSPRMRSFNFEFAFYPRSVKEAQEVQKILNLLRFHQAPEIMQGTGGFFLVPPSEFDIKFYYNGKVNPNIPRISTCVLENITVDYAPNGWAAYEKATDDLSSLIPRIGQTGMPVAIRMTLGFRETEIVTKQFINATESNSQAGGVDLSVYSSMTGSLDGGDGEGDGTELGR